MPKLKKLSLIVFTAVFMSPFYAGAADAASVTVAVSQVNPNSAVQTVTCVLLKPCALPFVINAGTPAQQSLTIHVGYTPGTMGLSFMTSGGFFYTDDTGDTTGFYNTLRLKQVQGNNPATYQITLFQPLALTAIAPILSVVREAKMKIAHPSVANLKITITPAP